MCLVTNETGILLGRLDQKQLRGDGAQLVEGAMRPGPSTYRPDVPATELRHLMAHRGIGELPSPPATVAFSAWYAGMPSTISKRRSTQRGSPRPSENVRR
jgi:hypothetical protein